MASAQIDDQFDMFGGFVAEIEGYLPVIAADVRQLLITPGDEALLEESHRFAHTIKSSAAMMGMPELRRVAVPLEALLARSYAGEVAVDEAMVATIDGTLTRMRRCLTMQQGGSDLEALVKANDHAYATLRTSVRGKQRPAGEDARERLLHADLPAPMVLLPVEGPLANDERDDLPAPPVSEADEEQVDLSLTMPPAARPWLTVLAGGPDADGATLDLAVDEIGVADAHERVATSEFPLARPSSTGAGETTALPARSDPNHHLDASASHSIAAEWLAEVLGAMPTGAGAPAGLAPAREESLHTPEREAAALAEVTALQQQWELRWAVERTALEEQLGRERQTAAALLAAERQQHAEQRRELLNQHGRSLREVEAAGERALQEQRETLEREVQRYVEDDLRPQLEDELRQELTHEFEVAALLNLAPTAVGATRPVATPAYAFVEDAALVAEMREIFAQEAEEHIQAIGEHILALRLQPEDLDHLQGLRRSVHTLKGAAATVGQGAVSALCHQIENALDRQLEAGTAVDGPGQSLLLLASCDTLEALVRGDDAALAQARALAERLSALTGSPVPRETVEEVDTSSSLPSALTVAGGDSEVGGSSPDYVPMLLPQPEVTEGAVPAHQREVELAGTAPAGGMAIRVALTELDRLMAANHELIITESALELRLQRLHRTLGDVRHTSDRLRAAGSRLESGRSFASLLAEVAPAGPMTPEVEVPTAPTWRDALRQQTDGRGPRSEFDTLEMDRYTEFHRLTREVSEAASDVATSDSEIGDVLDDLRLTLKQQKRLHALQNAVLLHARMVPLQVMLPRLARAVQAVAAQQGKHVAFVVEGQDTLLDRAVMEEVADALLHLVRNAVDHGMETPAERLASGKAAEGTILLTARRVGPEIMLALSDDGPGLDTAAIVRSARARGLVSATAHLSEYDIHQLIFTPGLSTAAAVTDISGRGVGLDVVRANIQSLRGEVELTSRPGAGTTFSLKVPISLALLTVALVEVAGNMYAIPLTLVRHVEKVASRRIQAENNCQTVQHGGRTYPVFDLATLLGLPAPAPGGTAPRSLVFIGAAQGTIALTVDHLAGKREVEVKDLGRQLQTVRGLHGATALGNGDLALILDVPALLQQDEPAVRLPVSPPMARRQRQLLVVDDSPSVRRLTCAVFERQGWQVRPARDGVEALDLLEGWYPDAVVMDIEMPRMDGFELLSILRRQPETAHVPTIMVTSRSGDKHREKAVRLGIDAYLVKPFREEELFGTVDGLVGQSSATAPLSTR
ncbi:MAG: response regulator [Chloroflexota bacterium]